MDLKPEIPEKPEVAVNPEAAQLLENTESVVHQTYQDLSGEGGIGETVDDTQATTETILKELRAFKDRYRQDNLQRSIEIKQEIANQLGDINNTLERFISAKTKVVFVIPQLPGFLRWIFRVKIDQKGGEKK